MRNTFMLDMYLATHVPALYTMIRNKALIQVGAPLGPPSPDSASPSLEGTYSKGGLQIVTSSNL